METPQSSSGSNLLLFIILAELLSMIIGLALALIAAKNPTGFNLARQVVDEPSLLVTAIVHYVLASFLLVPLALRASIRSPS